MSKHNKNGKSIAELTEIANNLLKASNIKELDKVLEELPKEEKMHSNKKDEPSKSDLIRELYEQGNSISQIARKLHAHYSFVYQVCKKHAEVVEDGVFSTQEPDKQTKADKMRELWDEGKNIGEIAKQLNANYSYVWSVVDTYRRRQELDARLEKTEETK